MGGTEEEGTNAAATGPDSSEAAGQAPVTELSAAEAAAAAPLKKDTSLREFLGQMDDYAPIVSV